MFLASILAEAAIPDPPTSGITTVGSLKLATAADCAGVVAFSATQASVDVSLIFEMSMPSIEENSSSYTLFSSEISHR